MLKKAADLLDVKEKELSEFTAKDSFNNHTLTGVICKRSDHRYGSLVIFKVDDWDTQQVIYCTPKLHYPFDKQGTYKWPNGIDEIRIWEKIDGTNICAYHYFTSDHKECITFKTRMKPCLEDHKYGCFYSMWKELLETHSWIYKAIRDNPDYSLSFELYGSRNPITIVYEKPLATVLLFGIRRSDYVVKPLSELNGHFNTPLEHTEGYLDCHNTSTERYELLKEQMTHRNDQTEELVVEGSVFYAHIPGEPSWRMFKCKPEQIEKIHWAAGGISKHSLWTTAINTFEDKDNPSIEDFIELLKEEFTDTQIVKGDVKIRRIFGEAKEHMKLKEHVNNIWRLAQQKGFDVTKDKVGTMRFLSQFFSKKEMSKVGTIILTQAGLIKKK